MNSCDDEIFFSGRLKKGMEGLEMKIAAAGGGKGAMLTSLRALVPGQNRTGA